ncbi:MAG: MarR family transcriptional regulator [Alphaproteobacteria bacterium]|nr:MAG: MarR family transcriptional regulator [Alphaproteobacteria bacterium]
MFLLHQAAQSVRSRLEARLRPLGVTGIQYTILAMVAARPGLSSAELSRRFFVTPQTMNETVAGLARRGLVTRCAAPGNRRVLILAPTADGLALLADCDRIADAVEADAFGWLGAEETARLRRLARRLLRGPRRLRDAGSGS